MEGAEGLSLGDLFLSLRLDPESFQSDLDQVKAIAELIPPVSINPVVNHQPLKELNRHLSLKQQHLKEVRRDFAEPISISFELNGFDQAMAQLEKLKQSASGITATVRTSTSSGSSQGNSVDGKEIGKEIAEEVRKGLKPEGSGIGGAIGSIISAPFKIAGSALKGAGEGIALGITQEVSKGLGRGLSTAMEQSLFKSVGSSELLAEKVGQKLGDAFVSTFSGATAGMNAVIEKQIENLGPIFKKKVEEIYSAVKTVPAQVVETVGGEQAITEENLYLRGQRQREQTRKRPIARQQSVEDWRSAIREKSEVESRLTQTEQEIVPAEKTYQRSQKALTGYDRYAQRQMGMSLPTFSSEILPMVLERDVLMQQHTENLFNRQKLSGAIKKERQRLIELQRQLKSTPESDRTQRIELGENINASQGRIENLGLALKSIIVRSKESSSQYQKLTQQIPFVVQKERANIGIAQSDKKQAELIQQAKSERDKKYGLQNTRADLIASGDFEGADTAEVGIEESKKNLQRIAAEIKTLKQRRKQFTQDLTGVTKLLEDPAAMKAAPIQTAAVEEVEDFVKRLQFAQQRVVDAADRVEQLQKQQAKLETQSEAAQNRLVESKAKFDRMQPTQQQPRAFQDLARTVLGQRFNQEKLPDLKVADEHLRKTNSFSLYNSAQNAIMVTSQMYEAIQNNSLTQEQIRILSEEIAHASDFDFGSYRGIQSQKQGRVVTTPVTPTTEEMATLAPELGRYKPEKRAIELNAKVQALRATEAYTAQTQQQSVFTRVTNLANYKERGPQIQKKLQEELEFLQKNADRIGADISGFIEKQSRTIQDVTGRIEQIGTLAAANAATASEEFVADLESNSQLALKILTRVSDEIGSKIPNLIKTNLASNISGVQQTAGTASGQLQDLIGRAKENPEIQKYVPILEKELLKAQDISEITSSLVKQVGDIPAANITPEIQKAFEASTQKLVDRMIVINGFIKNATKTIDRIAPSAEQLERRDNALGLLEQFPKKKLMPIAQKFGIETTRKTTKKDILQGLRSVDVEELEPEVFALTRAKAQRDLAAKERREERMQMAAAGAGMVASGTVKAGRSAFRAVRDFAQSDAASSALATVGNAARGVAESPVGRFPLAVAKGGLEAAKTTYGILDKYERQLLGQKGMGLKGLLQAGGIMAAATHVPMLAPAVEGGLSVLGHVGGGAGHMLGSGLGAQAANAVSGMVPPQVAALPGQLIEMGGAAARIPYVGHQAAGILTGLGQGLGGAGASVNHVITSSITGLFDMLGATVTRTASVAIAGGMIKDKVAGTIANTVGYETPALPGMERGALPPGKVDAYVEQAVQKALQNVGVLQEPQASKKPQLPQAKSKALPPAPPMIEVVKETKQQAQEAQRQVQRAQAGASSLPSPQVVETQAKAVEVQVEQVRKQAEKQIQTVEAAIVPTQASAPTKQAKGQASNKFDYADIEQQAFAKKAEIEGLMSSAYQSFQKAVKSGNLGQAKQYKDVLKRLIDQGKDEIDEFITNYQLMRSFNNDAGAGINTILGGLKGRLTQKGQYADRSVAKLERTQKMKPKDIPQDAIDVDYWGETLESQSLKLGDVTKFLNEQIAKYAEIEPKEKLTHTIAAAAQTPKGRDAIVNTAGFVAGTAGNHFGPVAGVAGDLMGALVMRNAISGGKHGSGDDLLGDMAGWAVGNLASQGAQALTGGAGIPLSGMAAAMKTVPKLLAMREKIQKSLTADTQSSLMGQDLESESLNGKQVQRVFSKGQRRLMEKLDQMITETLNSIDSGDGSLGRKDIRALDRLNRHAERMLQERAEIIDDIFSSEMTKRNQELEAIGARSVNKYAALDIEKIGSDKAVEEYQKMGPIGKLRSGIQEDYRASTLQDAARITIESKNLVNDLFSDQAAARAAGNKPEEERLGKYATRASGLIKQSETILNKPTIEITPQELRKLKDVNLQLKEVYRELKRIEPEGFSAFGGVVDALKDLSPLLKVVGAGFLGFQGIQMANMYLQDFIKTSLQAAMNLDRLKISLNYSSGGKADQQLKFVEDTAALYSGNLNSGREGFKQLSSATKGTKVEGQATQDLYQGISAAGSVLGMSPEQQERAFTAVSQIAQKGKAQAEELRGQLSETGISFQLVADSMGVSTAELNKMLELGAVTAEDLLPKLGKKLRDEFGGAAQEAGNTAMGAMARFETQTLKTQEAFGKMIQPAQVAGLSLATTALQILTSNIDKLALVVATAATVFASRFLASITLAAPSIGSLAVGFSVATQGALGLLKAMAPFLIQMAAVSLAVNTVKGLWDGFAPTDAGKKFEDLADKGVANIERIRKAAEDARNAVNGIPNKPQKETPSAGIDIGGALSGGAVKFTTDDIIKGYNKFERGFLEGASRIPGINQLVKKPGELAPLSTFGDIKAQQTVLQQDRAADVSRNLTGQFYSGQIDTEKGKVGIRQSFNQMKALDNQVRTFQQQKQIAQAQPKEKIDKEKIKQIDTQIETAQKQRTALNAPLQDYRNQLDAQIKGIKDAMASAAASGDTQAQQQAQLDLTQLEKTKKAFDDMARAAQANLMPLSKMAQDFEKINTFLEEIDRLANRTFNQKQADIAKTQNKDFATNKFSSVEAARKTASAEYDKSKLQYQGTKEALSAAEYSLKDPALQAELATITTSTGKSITKNSSISEIDDAKKRLGDKDGAKKDALDRLKQYKELQDQLIGQEATMRQNELKAREAMQAEYLRKFDELIADEQLKLKKIENKRSIAIKEQQLALIPEKINNVQSRSQLTMQRATFGITRDDADIKEAQIGRKDADLGVKEAQIQIQAAQDQMASAQEQAGLLQGQINELTRANKEGTVSAEEFSRRKRDLEGQLSDNGVRQAEAQLQIGQARLANEEALGRVAEANAKLIEANNKKLINDLERQRKEMEALINVSVTRNVATNRSVMLESPDAREYSQAGADRYQLQIEAQGVQDRIDLKKLEREQNKWLVENKKRDAQEGAEIERQLAQEQTDLEAQLIDKRISMNQKLRDARDSAEKAMLDAAQARSEAEQKALAVGEAQIEQQKKRLDLAKQLLDTEASVVQSRSNLEIARGEGQLKRIGSTRSLVTKLEDENLAPGLKEAITQRLASQGMNPNASDGDMQMSLLKQQQGIEDKIAQQRANQLQADMKVEQASLEIQIQQNKLQAEGVLLQAESNRLQAESNKANQLYNVAQAQKNLNDAGFAKLQAVQDTQTASTPLEKQMAQQALQAATYQEMAAQAMADAAQSGVDSADSQIIAAQMQAQSAQEQLGAQDQLANGMREALLNKQQAQVETFASDEFARKNGQFIEGIDLVNNRFQKLQKPVSDAAKGMSDVAKAAKEAAKPKIEQLAPGVTQMKDSLGNTATLYDTKAATIQAQTISTQPLSTSVPSVGELPKIAAPVVAPKVPNITPSIPEIKPPSIPGMQPKTPEMDKAGQSGIDKLASAIMNLVDRTRTPNLTVNNFGSGADAVKLWEDVNKQKAEGKKL